MIFFHRCIFLRSLTDQNNYPVMEKKTEPSVRLFLPVAASLLLLAVFSLSLPARGGESVTGLWKRFETGFADSSWEGNPFDVVLTVEFTAPSGRMMKQFGFYAGHDRWKVFFMPDETGVWHYRSSCADPDLDGRSGTFRCVKGRLDPPLRTAGRQWVLQGGGVIFRLSGRRSSPAQAPGPSGRYLLLRVLCGMPCVLLPTLWEPVCWALASWPS